MLNFPVGLGPVPWIFNSEIYPLHLRAIGYSMLKKKKKKINVIY